jgi:ABC-type transport system involved in multi-copper enzyme maturation permease subunit
VSGTERPASGFWSTASAVARFSVGELLWSPRTLAMIVLAAAPVGLALAYRGALALGMTGGFTPFGVFSSIVAGASFPFVAPMLTLVYANGVVSDDVESGTLRYFLTRPVTRSAFLTGKMLASLAMALVLFLPSIVVDYYAILAPSGLQEVGARFTTLVATLLVAALGLLAYNGIFALAGTFLRRPLLAGLFFIFGWQAVASFVPGRAHYLTVAHYLRSLMPVPASGGGLLGSLLGSRSSAVTSVLALLLIAALTHGLALLAFRRREVY